MPRQAFFLIILAGLAVGGGATAQAPSQSKEVLVTLRRQRDYRPIVREYGLRVLGQMPGTQTYRMQTPPGGVPKTLADMLTDGRVLSADPNLPSDTGPSNNEDQNPEDTQWTIGFDTDRGRQLYVNQDLVGQVRFNNAPNLANGAGVTVAVLDCGVSTRHPDLAGKVLPGWNFVEGNGDTDDRPRNVDSSGNGVPDEALGHGTAIAGLVTRFAPGAKILPVRVLNSDGQGSLWSTVQGIQYAIKRHAQVINLSLGTPVQSGTLAHAIQDAWQSGAVVVVSAGNGDTDRPQFPAERSETLSVAALNSDNTKASFSNYGSVVDVSAPGVGVISTFWDGTYVAWSGTSFATGIVSGEAALVISRAPGLRNDRVVKVIEDTAHSVDAQNPDYRGKLGDGGLIDIDAAVAAARRR